jgi:6-carboxyhexanoate--CoA ligase
MSEAAIFSVRMRAAAGGPHEAGGRHVSGAERLIARPALDETVLQLLHRADENAALPPDFVHITVERVEPAGIARIPCLPVTTVDAPDPASARGVAERLLARAGVAPGVLCAAFQALERGLGLHGAALFDAQTGARRDPDPARGVRASHVDYSPEGRAAAEAALAGAGLTHFRTREALAVAGKVLWAGALAELCWSDAPDYAPGYVATPGDGYVRFPAFKPANAAGGRVFFLPPDADVEACLLRLQRRSAWIDPPVRVHGPISVERFLDE